MSPVLYKNHLNRILFISIGVMPALFAKHPAHQDDSTLFQIRGGFTLDDAKIKELNGEDLNVNRYGTTTLLESRSARNPNPGNLKDPLTGKDIVIRDQHYTLYDFAKAPLSKWNVEKPKLGYGIRVIPAVTGYTGEGKKGTVVNSGAVRITGSETVDKYLREVVYGYQKAAGPVGKQRNRNEQDSTATKQPIFAEIAYVHPEGYKGEPFGLAGEPGLKTEMGFTHKGLYLGDGKTVNSPAGYHGDSWWSSHDSNYPAFINVIDFKGLVNANGDFNVRAFNQNGIMTALVLNETFRGPEFPSEFDYKFDPVYSVNLETVLDFYARWIENDPIFHIESEGETPESKALYRKAQFYKQYCAEHATEIVNVSINLPQNLQGYKEVYGEVRGAKLFDAAMAKIYNAPDFRSGAQAQWIRDAYLGTQAEYARQSSGDSMIPYWKILNPNQATPLMKRDDDNNTWIATDAKFTADPARGGSENSVGYSLGWRPETVADLLKDFVREYLPWYRVNALTTTTAVLGFSGEAKTRMNIDVLDYVKHITPVIQQIYLHEAAMEKGLGLIAGKSESDLFAEFDAKRAEKTKYLTGTMQSIALKMQQNQVDANGNVVAGLDAKAASEVIRISKTFMNLVAGNGAPEEDAGWLAASKIAKASLNASTPNTLDAKLAYRQSIYDNQFLPVVDPILSSLNKLDPNPTPELTVKYYYAPAVHVRVALGFHDQKPENPNEPNRRDAVRLWPVGHVIRAEETTPIEGNNVPVVDDTKFVNYQVL